MQEDSGITFTKSREPLLSPLKGGEKGKKIQLRKLCQNKCGRYIKDDKRMKFCVICKEEVRQEHNRKWKKVNPIQNKRYEKEIKFRAWDKSRNKMWFFGLEDMWGAGYGKNTVVYINKKPFLYENIAIYPELIMQYTGLKDKNGKEIYEGDIVKENRDSEDILFIVEPTDYLGFYFKNNIYSHEVDNGNNIKVIGNIYENPEIT